MHPHALLNAVAAQEPGHAALAVVAEVSGSAPRHVGSMMLVMKDGTILGTIGGGKVEERARQNALLCLETGKSDFIRVGMTGTDALGEVPICGGAVGIAILSVGATEKASCVRAAALLDRGERVVLEIGPGASSLRFPAEDDGASALLRCPIEPAERFLILGGGHVGLALARQASELDFRVCVGDFRPEYADPERFPAGVETRCAAFADIIADYPFDASTYAVVVSPDHLSDLECVRAILKRDYRYAGFIGSRRKTAMILGQVASEGFDPAKVDALHAPIGADIGAETPAEIAVSILAEVVAVRRNSPRLAEMDSQRAERRLPAGHA